MRCIVRRVVPTHDGPSHGLRKCVQMFMDHATHRSAVVPSLVCWSMAAGGSGRAGGEHSGLCAAGGTGAGLVVVCGSMRSGHDDVSLLLSALLEIFLGEQSRLAGGIADDDASLLGGLDVGLEVAADPVSDGDEGEVSVVEDVSVIGGELQEPLREAVVVLLLLDRVVECGMAEVLFAVGDQEGLKFWIVLPRELLSKNLLDCDSRGDAVFHGTFGVVADVGDGSCGRCLRVAAAAAACGAGWMVGCR
mmetsp:Transcript_10051/g.27538  ORF Transcript_10051/g.27538 Transcript_10051/m.27538 type:complete len:248 (+) Transcript_10051:1243-1986(+)